MRHNPLVRQFANMLAAAGRQVAVEQRDPSMGPNARLDIVEYASDVGAPAAYDVSIVTPLRADAAFREACAAEPGLAAELRHAHKLDTQYRHRVPGSLLLPLVAEVGGRWHASVPRLVRSLAKACAARSSCRADSLASAVVARWAARLSALLIRGNAAVYRAIQPPVTDPSLCRNAPTVALPHLVPEGACLYEVVCGSGADDADLDPDGGA